MAKEAMKIRLAEEQGWLDPYTGQPLDIDIEDVDIEDGVTRKVAKKGTSRIDESRLQSKTEGGTLSEPGNVEVANPRSHMNRHAILRVRDEQLEALKTAFDTRVQTMKLVLKMNNQLLAYERRTDHKDAEMAEWLKAKVTEAKSKLAEKDVLVTLLLKQYPSRLVQVALGVPGLGPITVAALTVYIDFKKEICRRCRLPFVEEQDELKDRDRVSYCECDGERTPRSATEYASSLWRYVGLDKPARARYEKGKKGGGNKTLRTVLFCTAEGVMKMNGGIDKNGRQRLRSAYRDVYDAKKARLEKSELPVITRNTQGVEHTCAWKDTKPSHRHGAALRDVMKHILADYWFVGRTLAGLPTAKLYVDEKLGHINIIDPVARGWKFSDVTPDLVPADDAKPKSRKSREAKPADAATVAPKKARKKRSKA